MTAIRLIYLQPLLPKQLFGLLLSTVFQVSLHLAFLSFIHSNRLLEDGSSLTDRRHERRIRTDAPVTPEQDISSGVLNTTKLLTRGSKQKINYKSRSKINLVLTKLQNVIIFLSGLAQYFKQIQKKIQYYHGQVRTSIIGEILKKSCCLVHNNKACETLMRFI